VLSLAYFCVTSLIQSTFALIFHSLLDHASLSACRQVRGTTRLGTPDFDDPLTPDQHTALSYLLRPTKNVSAGTNGGQ
jgi:hypothetical protein